MVSTPVRWLGKNVSTLLLAFILALIVWVSAVTAADPNQERTYQVQIEIMGQDTGIDVIGELPDHMLMTLYAPRSVLDQLTREGGALRAWIDLSGLEPGARIIPVQYQMPPDTRPVRIVDINPKSVEVISEMLISKTIQIQTDVQGEPALGYQAGFPNWSDHEVVISGRSSLIEQVANVAAVLDISGANHDIEMALTLLPQDADGKRVSDITLIPDKVTVTQSITLRGGYRNMVVKVITIGQVANGYRQTNISVSPPNVMVFSADPALINQLPGYIETELLNLTNIVDDIETLLSLNLPEGVSIIGDPNVLVQVGVATIEGSITVSRNVEIIGILPELTANASPESVEVIIYGPIPTLETLTDLDVRVVIDLTGLELGVYQLQPEVIILPDRIRLHVISPETVEITIVGSDILTPTPSPTPEE